MSAMKAIAFEQMETAALLEKSRLLREDALALVQEARQQTDASNARQALDAEQKRSIALVRGPI